MPRRRGHSRSRALPIAGAIVALLVVAGGIAFAVKPDAKVPDAGQVVGYTPAKPVPHPAFKLALPAKPNLLIIGDSWAAGYNATNASLAWSADLVRMLHWPATVAAHAGSGYAYSAQGTHNTTFYDIVKGLPAHPDQGVPNVAIMQGSPNDNHVAPNLVPAAELKTIRLLKSKYPGIRVFLMVPIYNPKDIGGGSPAAINHLTDVAIDEDAAVINGNQWFDSSLWAKYTNPKNNHPTDAGYAYVASKVKQRLSEVFQTRL